MQNSNALAISWWPIGKPRPYGRNPRKIPAEAVAKVAASLAEFGFRQPIVVDKDGVIIVGHTRLKAATQLGMKKVPVHVAKDMTPEQAKAYRLADNRVAEFTEWDLDALTLEIGELKELSFDIEPLGFSVGELEDMFAEGGDDALEGHGDDQDDDQEPGSLLDLAKVTIAEPRYKVEKGDHYLIDKRHHLLVVGVMTDWPMWAPLLEKGAIFCPYPGPYVPYGKKVADHALIMVQPDKYTAGHLLDRFAEIKGRKSIRKVAA